MLEYVHFNAQMRGSQDGDPEQLNEETLKNICDKLKQAISNIKEFKKKPFLLA